MCAGHVQRTALVDGARIGTQNAILCWCNTTLGINLRVHGAHNVGINIRPVHKKSNIPYWVGFLLFLFSTQNLQENEIGSTRLKSLESAHGRCKPVVLCYK